MARGRIPCSSMENEKSPGPDAKADDASDYGTDKYCTCNKYNYDEHTCPFQEEVLDDYKSLCTCCPYCEYQCAMDI